MAKKTIITLAAALIMAPTLALAGDHHDQKHAQFNYTGPVETTTVDTLLQNNGMFSEQDAVVEGFLIRQVKHDTYLFSDDTGEIQIELDDDINVPQNIDASTKVRLFGEYEGGKTPEIEVERLQVL